MEKLAPPILFSFTIFLALLLNKSQSLKSGKHSVSGFFFLSGLFHHKEFCVRYVMDQLTSSLIYLMGIQSSHNHVWHSPAFLQGIKVMSLLEAGGPEPLRGWL